MILDHVSLYGGAWLTETWKLVQEDKANALNDMLMILPTARTPQDKKSAQQLNKYIKQVYRVLGKRTPWRATRGGKLSHLRDKIPSGETRVMLSAGENGKLDLFKGVKQIRE